MADTHDLKKTKTPLTNFRLKPLTACVRLLMAGGTFVVASPTYAELPMPSANWVSPGGIATHETIGNALNIKQETDRVILNWDKFNVTEDSAVNYKQPASTSIALNRIGGNDPSNIMGTISANGQVYLVNKNGFVFGKDSVVNTHGLVASTLDVKDQVFMEGIGKVINNAVPNSEPRAAFEGTGEFFRVNSDGKREPITVKVEEGAQIKAGEGKRILIIAPTIENKGDIEAPGGQVILAAATDKVYLQEADPKKSDVRGLLVEVKTGGRVENFAKIAAERGNVTLMGFAVNQQGKVSATTTTNLNGTIRLLAREGAQVNPIIGGALLQSTSTTRTSDQGDELGLSAKVTLGESSQTEVQPQKQYIEVERQLESGQTIKELEETTAVDGQTQPQSHIEIMGHQIHLKGGSEINAPSGKVEVTATEAPLNPVSKNSTNNRSKILIDSGAKIDVSGIDTVVKPMESNIVKVELRSFELKDAPIQKNGILKNKTILVDIRKGTPITDIKPFVEGIKHKLDERLTKGGSISLSSEGNLVSEDKSVLDFSGGAITYLDGFINSTVLSSNGRLIDISEADPLLTYDGIYGEVIREHKKWGVTEKWLIDSPFSPSRREIGYIEGSDAGSLFIKAANVILQGDLLAHTINGRTQRSLSTQAKGGLLEVNNGYSTALIQSLVFTNAFNKIDLDLDDVIPENYAQTLALKSDYLVNGGIQQASFISNGTVAIANNSTVKLSDGGSFSLKGGAININGGIEGKGAAVALTTATEGTALDGHITLDMDGKIRLQGGWVNDFVSPKNLDGRALAIDGGAFNAKADGDINLKKGSLIDVSGGAWVQVNNELTAGSAGGITLTAKPKTSFNGANISLDGELKAFGLGKGGTLALEANAVAIRRQREEEVEGLRPLQIETGFFDKGGFSEFSLASNINGLKIEEGAVINLIQKNRLLDRSFLTKANDSDIETFSQEVFLLPEQRTPSHLTLRSDHSAGNVSDSNLVLAKNAKIIADDKSSITFVSDTSLILDGEITARGGNVELNITPDKSVLNNDPRYVPTQGIWLGDTAKINVSGTSQIMIDGLGRRSGKVFDGGNVTVKADRGFFASLENSLIDISGTQEIFDLPHSNPTVLGVSFDPTLIGSDAGSINITTSEGVFTGGKMLAKAGDAPGTSGGHLSIAMNIDRRIDPDFLEGGTSIFPSDPRVLVVSQEKNQLFKQGFNKSGDALPTDLIGSAYISSPEIADSGFSSLALGALSAFGDKDVIRFEGDVAIQMKNSIVLNASKFNWSRKSETDAGNVELKATTVELGTKLFRSNSDHPTDGDGQLTVTADLIDLVGGSVTSGFKSVTFNAEDDIRLQGTRISGADRDFVGEFKTFSKLNLTADQIYPTTLSQFNLVASSDPSGTVAFSNSGNSKPVLSALSKLIVTAPNIEQNGTVKAPLGEIVFNASSSVKFGANSVTSVSADGQIIPFGVTRGNIQWLFPLLGNAENLIIEAPQKKISVKADRILRDEGALIDLSGGGDLLAFEFIAGPGGSVDVLESDKIFAVLPGHSKYAPVDPLEFPKSGLSVGDNIVVSAGSGLSAGEYTLLPARYALLPGAFLVSPQSTVGDVIPGSTRSRVDGAPVVSGYRTVAGTDIRNQNWEEFVIEPGSIAPTRSEYNIDLASSFFAERAARNEKPIPRLPQDAGQLVFDAQSQLDLPTVRADVANNALGGLVDIVADKISVVSNKSGNADQVELLADDIGKLKVGSLLLGAVRSIDNSTSNTRLDVKAKSVAVADNTIIKAPEILLAATDKVELKKGSRIQAEGKALESAGNEILDVAGDGALLRASTGSQAIIKRTGTQGLKGDLIVGENAVISAGSGAVIIDSTSIAKMEGELELSGGSLTIGAGAINIGEVEGVTTSGLSLDNNQLSKIAAKELVLTSRSTVNIFGQLVKAGVNGNPELDGQGNFKPVEFGNLMIESAGLSGQLNDGKTAFLKAKTLTLTNKSGAIESLGGGTGTLNVNSEQLILDKGNYKLSGFNQTNFNLTNALIGRDESQLTALGNVTFKMPLVSAESGAKTTIDATGHTLLLDQATQGLAAAATSKGIAGSLNLIADSVTFNTAAAYQAGNVNLAALEGNVTLGSNAIIDVSGVAVNAGLSKPVKLSAGKITLSSQKQNVQTDAGSLLQLKGTNSDMAAGLLTANAGQGQVLLSGLVDAHSVGSAKGGRVAFDIGNLATVGFNGFNTLFSDAGFTGGIALRLRNGDINVDSAQTIAADTIKLTADSGKITVAGTLDASRDEQGGTISLSSEDQLTLESTAQLLAKANGSNGTGGKVKLSSIEKDLDGAGIVFNNGASINVSASGSGAEGEVELRADRFDSDGDGVLDINIKTISPGAIIGDSSVLVEAVKIYNDTSVDSVDQEVIKADTQAYMDGLTEKNVTNSRFGAGFQIQPGVEIRSAGDLALASVWNFVNWRYGIDKAPGIVTLRAVGDILIQQNLTDAFAPGQIDTVSFGIATIEDFLQSGHSWSYNIIGGADLSSADTDATIAGIGDVNLSEDVKIRTGTGDVHIHTGRDIVYGDNNSVVYTAGRPDDLNRWGFTPLITAGLFYAEYPLDGGDVSLAAGRDIIGKPTQQLTSGWLVRTGNWSRNETHAGERPTAWGVAFGSNSLTGLSFQHQQSVAALGGGNVNIFAGGNINDLSVVIPTTGKQLGEKFAPEDPNNIDYKTNIVEINGGGHLQVNAGGDIAGGIYHIDGGTANLLAGRSLTVGGNPDSQGQGLSPILALGDSQFKITAGKDIALEAVIDPMILPLLQSADTGGIDNVFFRYSKESSITMTSIAGNITLENDVTAIHDATDANIDIANGTFDSVKIYPASIYSYALEGDINIKNDLNMYPSSKGGLEFFATKSIVGNAVVNLSDADPGLLPTMNSPTDLISFKADTLRRLDPREADANYNHAKIPLHTNDDKPVLMSTGKGDIVGTPDFTLFLAKHAQVNAGLDLRNVSFRIQHNTTGINTLINARRDVKFDILFDNKTGEIDSRAQIIEVAGPGQLTVLAGRNIDLGSSQGIITDGDMSNPSLADEGANITALAGLADGKINVVDFAEKFMANSNRYTSEYLNYLERVIADMRIYTSDLSLTPQAALEIFKNLPASEKPIFEGKFLDHVEDVFFMELKRLGNKLANATTKQGQEQAELELLATIETLFPGTTLLSGNKDYSIDSTNGVTVNGNTNARAILDAINTANTIRPKLGGMSLVFSTIQTKDGGSINLITPNGGINAGLAASFVKKEPENLGVIVKRKGDINEIGRDNFAVNTTRVMTLGGGHIMAGSTEGNIDAGRSPKTALSAPLPDVTYDAQSDPIIEIAPVLAGGGIRSLPPLGSVAGDILLFAPRGIIDAAEAGIGGNNVTLSASAIVGADNIDVGGVSVGVPVAATGSVAAGLTGVSNLAASVTNAVASSTNMGKDASDTLADKSALGLLSVDILGFGE